tara:strand:- start:360737 stop:361696 length:960 start_codon:yes stop_codon:yes gene_type:complete
MKKVVTIGGGTGSFNLLSGLKHYDLDLASVVTTFDSGGSTGVLRDEFGTLPGGDVRRALVALAPDRGDQFLRELFQVRFESPGSSLHNHSFGNLFLLAAERVTKDKVEGIKEIAKLFSIKGRVLPVSLDDAHLCVGLESGEVIKEEANIDNPEHDGSVKITKAWLEPEATLNKEAKEAIKEADYIIFGPGDLYTSIIANVLVDGFKDAIKESNAKLIFVANIMSKWGETHGMGVHEYAKTLLSYIGKEKFDVAFVNEGELEKDLLDRYKEQNKEMLALIPEEIEKYARKTVVKNFMSRADVARHNSEKTAEAIVEYIQS